MVPERTRVRVLNGEAEKTATPETDEQAALLAGALRGDKNAFARLCEGHRRRGFSICYMSDTTRCLRKKRAPREFFRVFAG